MFSRIRRGARPTVGARRREVRSYGRHGHVVARGHARGRQPAGPADQQLQHACRQPLGTPSGVTYQASSFPLGLRVTAPDGSWSGTQWRTTSRGKPAFGWAEFGHGPGSTPPRGVVELETAYGPTPSVAATIARLRRGGSHLPASHVGGITFQAASPVNLAGYPGRQFDGTVWGIYGHTFVPFSATTGGASPADSFRADQGEVFRLVALNVNGKTVVLFSRQHLATGRDGSLRSLLPRTGSSGRSHLPHRRRRLDMRT